uniref:Uncharacterized protein n=1 Tax=Anguilla anguilla TaxID=7936 RepID=A0A0E9WS03_ANGAN
MLRPQTSHLHFQLTVLHPIGHILKTCPTCSNFVSKSLVFQTCIICKKNLDSHRCGFSFEVRGTLFCSPCSIK